MSGRGRPQVTYADPYVVEAIANQGQWSLHVIPPEEATKVARKIRRDELAEARILTLDEESSVLAVRSTHAQPNDGQQH